MLYIEILSFIIITIASFMSSVKYVHIFQLNSYAHDTQWRWIKNNAHKLIPNFIFGIIGIALSLFTYAQIPVFILAAFVNKYKKAKKPLVYTQRIKRLLTTIMLITVIIPFTGFFIGKNFFILFAIIMYIMNPMIILFSDYINTPVERCVKKYYINDAVKLLSNSNAEVIGVTGSYGKTSVKYYLNTLMNSEYDVLMTPESYNTPMGVVKTIREKLTARHKYFICEMGARRVGDIKEICDIVNPKYGIITSVGPQHLETFGSIENVINTKFELADAINDNNILFANYDNSYIRDHVKKYSNSRQIVTYGKSADCDYRFETVDVSSHGTSFIINAKGNSYEYSTGLIGEHNVLNITGAIAVANTLGIPLQKLVLPVRRLEGVPHRLQLINKGNAIVIDDAYNSNPSGAKAALDTLSLFDEYKILVTPGMVELGDKQYECNKKFGEQAASVCDYIILVGKKQAEPILDGMSDYPKDKYFIADTITEAINHAYSLHTSGMKKVILLENDLPDNYLY